MCVFFVYFLAKTRKTLSILRYFHICDSSSYIRIYILHILTNPHIPDALIRCIYELKILTINGQGPQVFQCVNCGNKAETAVFSAGRGGLVCETCAGEVRDGIRLASSTLYSMQYIESSKVEHLYTFNVKPEILQQLSKVTERLMGLYVDRKFKSLEILETLL